MTAMKRIAIPVVALLAAGCSGDGGSYSPTAPSPWTTPPPQSANLAGTWTGTVGVTWEEGGGCVLATTATFAQNGSTVSGTLTGPSSSDCIRENQFRFEGTLEGDFLHGSILSTDSAWPTSGRVSGDQLSMTAFNVRWDLRR